MKRFIWCGASWETGDELTLLLPKDQIKNNIFPQLVSDHYNVTCVNLAEHARCIEHLIWQFKSIENTLTSNDIIFFSLPAPHWSMFIGDDEKVKRLSANYKNDHRIDKYSEYWFKYFDNSNQRAWRNDMTLEFLANWCENKHIQYFFYAQANHYYPKYLTKAVNWLIPPNQCIAEFIVPVIDDNFYEVVTSDREWLKTSDWALQQPLVEKYISPCYCHPNIEGHKKIAQSIIEILNTKLI